MEKVSKDPCLRCDKIDCFKYVNWESYFTQDEVWIGTKGRICKECGHVEFFDGKFMNT